MFRTISYGRFPILIIRQFKWDRLDLRKPEIQISPMIPPAINHGIILAPSLMRMAGAWAKAFVAIPRWTQPTTNKLIVFDIFMVISQVLRGFYFFSYSSTNDYTPFIAEVKPVSYYDGTAYSRIIFFARDCSVLVDTEIVFHFGDRNRACFSYSIAETGINT